MEAWQRAKRAVRCVREPCSRWERAGAEGLRWFQVQYARQGHGWTGVVGDGSEVKTRAVPGEQLVWTLSVTRSEVADSFPGDVVANHHTLVARNHRNWSSHSSGGPGSATELSSRRVLSGPWAGAWPESLRRLWCSWGNLDGCMDPSRQPLPPSSGGLLPVCLYRFLVCLLWGLWSSDSGPP